MCTLVERRRGGGLWDPFIIIARGGEAWDGVRM